VKDSRRHSNGKSRRGLFGLALCVLLQLPIPVSASNHDGSSELVRDVQVELVDRGYYTAEPDGLKGRDTRTAVEAFQQDAGFAVNGRVDLQLLAQLQQRAFVGQPYFSVAAGRSPSVIGNVQVALSRAGYYRGPVDGVLNPATRAAIQQYRTAPYEQIFGEVYPRAYPYLSPALAIGSGREPLQDYPGLQMPADLSGIPALQAGDYATAIEQSTAVIRAVDTTFVTRASAFFIRGLAYLESGRPQVASQDFTSVLRIEPDHAVAYYNRSVAYEKAGFLEFSRRDFRRAVALLPELDDTVLEGLPVAISSVDEGGEWPLQPGEVP
jgi:peptidoglycan hydrolase-like protein with peptidoglycan-binding domain